MFYVIIVSCYMKKLNFLHLKEDKKESNIERNEILMSMVKSQLSSITAVREREGERGAGNVNDECTWTHTSSYITTDSLTKEN